MPYNAEKVRQLKEKMEQMGYMPEFCELISRQLCTDWTADRMLGYLKYVNNLKEEDIVDEMLAILSDRDRITKKKEMEFYQGKINEIYNRGLYGED